MSIEIQERWKLILGGKSDVNNVVSLQKGEKSGKGDGGNGNGEGEGDKNNGGGNLQEMCDTLDALYDSDRQGGLGSSNPKVNRWLGDIRKYFPQSAVSVMQKDAMDKIGLQRLLMEPEFLETVEVDVEMIATIMSLSKVMPPHVQQTAKVVVQKLVKELEAKLTNPTRQAIQGALSRSVRNHRPKLNEINWHKTIKANMKHYQADYQTVIPEKLIGMGRRGQSLKDIILCIDQSGSMGTSVVYSGIFGAVMASLNAVSLHFVVFDTAVVELKKGQDWHDPVDILFGVNLGGGTDINKALAYCQTLIKRPADTILVLISDLYEGGNSANMLKRTSEIMGSGVNMIGLLALNDKGAPSYDTRIAGNFAEMGIPCFACTPDLFPSLMATAIQKKDIYAWLNQEGLEAKR